MTKPDTTNSSSIPLHSNEGTGIVLGVSSVPDVCCQVRVFLTNPLQMSFKFLRGNGIHKLIKNLQMLLSKHHLDVVFHMPTTMAMHSS